MEDLKLVIGEEARKIMLEDAEQAYPDECCGFLFGSEIDQQRQITLSMPIVNSKEGDKRRRFQIAPTDYLRAERFADENQLSLLGVYHSHPEHPAQPSEHDRSQAMPWFSYIIISVYDGNHKELNSFRLNQERQFDQESISQDTINQH